ncbi:MAG TPA: hypothetical protein VIK53_04820 [Verrucomicrobiae bacterium]
MKTKNQIAFAAATAVDLATLPAGDSPEYNLQFMPPGAQDIVCWVNGKPRRLAFTVTAKHAELFNSQLQAMIARARAGEGDKPLTDYNHDGGAASSRPARIEWGGDDAKTGGIRLIGKWTGKARAAIQDEEFDRFSPKWDFDNQTGEPLEIKTNVGGLVNEAAFKKIAQAVAAAAELESAEAGGPGSGRHAGGGKVDAPEVGNPKSYSDWVKNGEKLPADHPLNADNRKLWAQKALGIKTPGEMSDKELETAANVGRSLPSHSTTTEHLREISDERTARSFGKTNLAAASAAASSANPPVKTGTTESKKMTETEIATAVAKGVEAANTKLAASITKLEEKITGLETKQTAQAKDASTALAKSTVAKHVARGAIAPQDTKAIAFWEGSHVANAADAEEQLNKLPAVVRGRVIPATTCTASAAADPYSCIVTAAKELRKANTAFASDAQAMEAYIRTERGNAEYEDYRESFRDGRANGATVSFRN